MNDLASALSQLDQSLHPLYVRRLVRIPRDWGLCRTGGVKRDEEGSPPLWGWVIRATPTGCNCRHGQPVKVPFDSGLCSAGFCRESTRDEF